MKDQHFIWLSILLGIALIACNKKDDYMGYTPGKGKPTITGVYTFGKTILNDTVITTHQSYDTAGNLTSYTDTIIANSSAPEDSATTVGSLGNLYVIHGSNLGSATAVYFNGTRAYFNRALGTDKTIIVQVPSEGVPTSGAAATDSLVVTTLHGTASYHFVILAPPPTIHTISDYDFYNGGQITLSGLSFGGIQSVLLKGIATSTASKGLTSNKVTIVHQTDSVLTLQFGTNDITQGNLVFAYKQSDGTVDTAVSSEVLNNIDKAYQLFTDDYQNGWGSWSWGPTGTSTDFAKSGTSSFYATFNANAWWINGFRQGGGSATDGLVYSSDYQYLSFWVKGGSMSEDLYVEWGNAGFTQDKNYSTITVLPDEWQFFKIPISTLKWNAGSTDWAANSEQLLNTVAFFLPGNTVDETFYFDNIMIIK